MSGQNAKIEQEIIQLSHQWIEAVGQRDGDVLDRILDDDFVIAGWQPGGQLGSKEFYIKDCLMPTDVRDATFSYEQWKIRIYDKFVIANCIFKCHALVYGKDWGGEFLFTDVWINKGSGWRVLTRHSSPILDAQGEN
jgi:hypothetical protein